MALGFVVPVSVVREQTDPEKFHLIGEDLFHMFIGVAVFTTVLLLVIVIGE